MTSHSWDLHRAAVAGLLAEGLEELEDMEDILDKAKKKRSCWVQPWMASNMGQNPPIIYHELHDGVHFLESFRMDQPTFENILNKVRPLVEKKTTQLREPIPAKTRLMVTLIYLASGPSFNVLSKLFRISAASVCHIIPEVCEAIWITMAPEEIRLPSSSQEWEEKAKQFDTRWQYPKALGCIDGKHVIVQAPGNSGSAFYNYKKSFSFVLMAVADANYRFIMVDIGALGSSHDAGTFSKSQFGLLLANDGLNLPATPPDGIPYHFLSDDAFSLQNRIMKPFSSKSLNPKERIFNYRLSRARRTVESAFGIMSGKFRLLRRPMDQNYGKCVSCVKAITVLHNHLLRPNDVVTQDSPSLMAPLPVVDRRRVNASGSAEVRKNREEMAQYFFSGDGQVDWQWDKTFGT